MLVFEVVELVLLVELLVALVEELVLLVELVALVEEELADVEVAGGAAPKTSP